jgi:chlorosome envelope protein I
MNLIINDKSCISSVGQTVGRAARLNHSHVGYVCGGQGVCNACYVTVLEGAEFLAPLTDIETAALSPRQIAAGGRMACQATLAKEGIVKVLSRPEEVRRTLFTNPLDLFAYGARMGQDTVQQIGPAVRHLAGRITRGEVGGKDAPGDLIESLQGAIGLAVETLPLMIPFREQVAGLLADLPAKLPFRLPFGQPAAPATPIERVTISVAPSRD